MSAPTLSPPEPSGLDPVDLDDSAFVALSPAARWVRWLDAAFVVGCCLLILWLLRIDLVLRDTTATGGDMGAHVWSPAYLRDHLLPNLRLAGWSMDYFGGFPAGQFYFPLPALLVLLLDLLLPYNVAFKLVTVLGPVSLPAALWWFGRGIGLRRPAPTFLALVAVAFLTFTPDVAQTVGYNQRIMGGLLLSNLAGEFSFAIALSLAFFFIGTFVWCLGHRRRYWVAALLLSAVIMSHIVVAMFAVAAAILFTVSRAIRDPWSKAALAVAVAVGFLTQNLLLAGALILVAVVFTLLRLRRWGGLARATAIGVVGAAITGVWLVPLVTRLHGYTTNMRYTKLTDYIAYLFPSPFFWAFAFAAIGVFVGLVQLRRTTLELVALAAVCAGAFVVWPELTAWNLRLLPFWYLTVFALAAVGMADLCHGLAWLLHRQAVISEECVDDWAVYQLTGPPVLARSASTSASSDAGPPPIVTEAIAAAGGGEDDHDDRFDHDRHDDIDDDIDDDTDDAPLTPVLAERALARIAFVPTVRIATVIAVLVATVALMAIGNHASGGTVPLWAKGNYEGYEGKSAYPEYKALMDTMAALPPGRALWEKNVENGSDTLATYGTDFALMMLPYWTDGRIASMEDLYFESSASTPYVFLTTAHVARDPSNVVRGLPYVSPGLTDFRHGVAQMRTLGVRYYMAQSEAAKKLANDDPGLVRVASVPDMDGFAPHGWVVYELKDWAEVAPLGYEPVVVTDASTPDAWLTLASAWFESSDENLEKPIAADGPASWKRVKADDAIDAPRTALPENEVTNVTHTEDSIGFDVATPGVPVVVRTSDYPNWEAQGANGPWKLTPNLMVVVPTGRHVTMTFGRSHADWAGIVVSILGLLALIPLVLWGRRPVRVARARRAAGRRGVEPQADDPVRADADAGLRWSVPRGPDDPAGPPPGAPGG